MKNERIAIGLLFLLGASGVADPAEQASGQAPATETSPPAALVQPDEDSKSPPAGRSAGSVRPGINDRFLDPELKIEEWLGRFEVESREVFAGRQEILLACNVDPGMRIADIGAGTGFFTRLFSEAVGEDGWVFAVDIAPKFLEHINARLREQQVGNVTSVLCSDRSIHLPPRSVDLVFVCDTYHHFEYPPATLASIHRALKPTGTLVVVDFERIPGKSREFILGHVRAGKEVFTREIVDAGFILMEEVDVPSLEENYLLRFRKR